MKKKINEEIKTAIAQAVMEKGEIVIRTGEALPAREPITVEISGNIDAPAMWIESKFAYNFEEFQNKCHVVVERDAGKINLCEDERSYLCNCITGKLELSKEYKAFAINEGNYFPSQKLADFLKMHRSCFANKQEAMNLVAQLYSFEAKVNTQIKDADDRRGNVTKLRKQVVQSNLPDSFSLCIPIFKGLEKQTIEVEVYIDPSTLGCTLVSADAEDIKTELTYKAIDDVLERIKTKAPHVTIIEA